MGRSLYASAPVVVVDGVNHQRRLDSLATEEPLEIRLGGPGQQPMSVVVTMRTPGHDFELATGFLFSEELTTPGEIRAIRYCVDPADGSQQYNIVTVELRRPVDPSRLTRRFGATAACGLCGKATLDDLALRCGPVAAGFGVPASLFALLPERVRSQQRIFEHTGGLHAAALFEKNADLVVTREDVGRHNAVDKVIGAVLLERPTTLADHILVVSGRLGFEIVQKAAVAGIPIVAAVSAPSTLAVDTAERFGITLVGFLRGDRFNVYSHAERVALWPDSRPGKS